MMNSILTLPSREETKDAKPLLTLFTVLKPFEGEADSHQRNAIASWRALEPDVEILLVSNTRIPEDVRSQFHCYQATKINRYGTPLLDEVFRLAASKGRGAVRAFVNADIILDHRFVNAAEQLMQSKLHSWLAIGQRIELEMPNRIDHSDDQWISDRFQEIGSRGTAASSLCKDFFLFPADLFQDIPAFAIGRGNWDNWMVWKSKASHIPVVDISQVAPVIHQEHGYSHVPGGRMSAYVSGPEARENQRLAGGRNWLVGSTPNWRLDKEGIHPMRFATLRFSKDLLRVASLLRTMIGFPNPRRVVKESAKIGVSAGAKDEHSDPGDPTDSAASP
ncbi:hypothetical protein [Novipirellula artificiosorum]|uniref:Glycosyl transferase family 2 n=1 Tax=Novipirellula artificiosorum TaxID=2528016 RepID=A0A5C6D7E7_9BACT|nr:hypothetical protein [Novipirellula artificiosorum]TWU31975.1 hypothetical protein Poly41_58630 [Novipirellula artificiosorum]